MLADVTEAAYRLLAQARSRSEPRAGTESRTGGVVPNNPFARLNYCYRFSEKVMGLTSNRRCDVTQILFPIAWRRSRPFRRACLISPPRDLECWAQ